MDDAAIVVGASSGIGEALARKLAVEGYAVGLTARRRERLEAIADDLPTEAHVAEMDVAETEAAREAFLDLDERMGGADLVVLNAGVGYENRDLDWETDRRTIDTNVRGFAALATLAMDRFECRGSGHLVGISSVGAHVGDGTVAGYNASKAFVSRYLEGLRYRTRHLDAEVDVTTIEPGFVDTEMAGGTFWMCSPETAADQIYSAIESGRRHAYVTRRWRLVAWVLASLPDVVKRRLF